MTATEQYLQRATRGLWGQKKRDAMTELRGAIEDKTYRHRLCGLSESEAQRAALHDLGDPGRIARDLRAVHVLPRQLQAGLALSVAALLGLSVRVTAQVAGAPYVQASVNCDYSPTGVGRLEGEFGPQQALRRRLETATPSQLEAQCREVYRRTSDALDYASLLRVLRERGVTDTATPPEQTGTVRASGLAEPPGTLWLHFPGAAYDVVLDPPYRTSDGRQLLSLQRFVQSLLVSGLPVSVAGDVNPRLTVGTTALTLGTPSAPVLATGLYTGVISLRLSALMHAAAGFDEVAYLGDPATGTLPLDAPPAVIATPLEPGTLVSGLMRERQPDGSVATGWFTTRVTPEGLSVPHGDAAARVEVVDTPQALGGAFPPGIRVRVLMVRLTHTDNLRDFDYKVLTAAQVRR